MLMVWRRTSCTSGIESIILYDDCIDLSSFDVTCCTSSNVFNSLFLAPGSKSSRSKWQVGASLGEDGSCVVCVSE